MELTAGGCGPGPALIVALLDLTSLEPDDDADTIRRLAARGRAPAPGLPPVAAVCVLPQLAAVARAELTGTPVRVAAVAGSFPDGAAPPEEKAAEAARAVEAGADEIDLATDAARVAAGDDASLAADVEAVRAAIGPARLKVILETGLLADPVRIRRAARVALEAGADVLKTSTGKRQPGATPGAAHALAATLAAWERETGERRGLKLAGGIRTCDDARAYLAIATACLGEGALVPERVRIGASALLDDAIAEHGRLS
jgi:deoxyribose-phosphate aldolase